MEKKEYFIFNSVNALEKVLSISLGLTDLTIQIADTVQK